MPPMYEIVANTKRNIHGVPVFEAQAIKISGGTNPKKVSESKKKEIILV